MVYHDHTRFHESHHFGSNPVDDLLIHFEDLTHVLIDSFKLRFVINYAEQDEYLGISRRHLAICEVAGRQFVDHKMKSSREGSLR
jgi:hypothetical protein